MNKVSTSVVAGQDGRHLLVPPNRSNEGFGKSVVPDRPTADDRRHAATENADADDLR
jgi:hypothetical protein